MSLENEAVINELEKGLLLLRLELEHLRDNKQVLPSDGPTQMLESVSRILNDLEIDFLENCTHLSYHELDGVWMFLTELESMVENILILLESDNIRSVDSERVEKLQLEVETLRKQNMVNEHIIASLLQNTTSGERNSETCSCCPLHIINPENIASEVESKLQHSLHELVERWMSKMEGIYHGQQDQLQEILMFQQNLYCSQKFKETIREDKVQDHEAMTLMNQLGQDIRILLEQQREQSASRDRTSITRMEASGLEKLQVGIGAIQRTLEDVKIGQVARDEMNRSELKEKSYSLDEQPDDHLYFTGRDQFDSRLIFVEKQNDLLRTEMIELKHQTRRLCVALLHKKSLKRKEQKELKKKMPDDVLNLSPEANSDEGEHWSEGIFLT